MDNTIEVIERGDYRVTIWSDIYAECPVQTCDMAAVHLFEYDGWLSDGCDWRELFGDNRHALSEAVARLAMENVSLAKIVRYIAAGQLDSEVCIKYDVENMTWVVQRGGAWPWQYECDREQLSDAVSELLETYDTGDIVDMIHECSDMVIRRWSSRGYSQGDYMAGVSFITRDRYSERVDKPGDNWANHARECMAGEIKEIERWAWGDVLGYTLEQKVPFTKVYADGSIVEAFEWKEVESVGGWYEDKEELIAEVFSGCNVAATAATALTAEVAAPAM